MDITAKEGRVGMKVRSRSWSVRGALGAGGVRRSREKALPLSL